MSSIKQLIRQPLRWIAGIALTAFAVCVLCICVGQALTALNFETYVEEMFTTIALPTGRYQMDEDGVYLDQTPKEVVDAVDQLIQNNQELIIDESPLGLASAYIPQLKLDNFTQHPNQHVGEWIYCMRLEPQPYGAPYSCAMLEILLEQIGEPSKKADGSIWIVLKGTVEHIVGLQEGFSDCTGFHINLRLDLPNIERLNALELRTEQRYLVYGTNYYDSDWESRSFETEAHETGVIGIDAYNPERLVYLSEEKVAKNMELNPFGYHVANYSEPEKDIYIAFTEQTIDMFRTVSLTAVDESVMPEYRTMENAEQYSIPTIVPLTGSAEDFLSSEDGLEWNNMLNQMEINNHAFPVIGVTNLNAVPDFNRELAKITDGRDFTVDELETGANVCVIAQSLAEANGLRVGDSITLNYYQNDENLPYQDSLAEGNGVQNPTAAMYFEGTTPFVGGEQVYTIVGVYLQDNEWANQGDNAYSFTPNTVFVPQNAVPTEMEVSDQFLFGAIQVKNGSIDALTQAMFDADYDYLFDYYDQGYSIIKENLQNYSKLAKQAMGVGLAVYGVILAVFLMMFPLRQGDVIRKMGSLGANGWNKISHVVISALGVLVPGTVIGTILSVLLWNLTVTGLTGAVAVDLSLDLDIAVISMITIVQFLLAVILVLLCAFPMTRNKSLMRKR